MSCKCVDNNGDPIDKCIGTCMDTYKFIKSQDGIEFITSLNVFFNSVYSSITNLHRDLKDFKEQISKDKIEDYLDGYRRGFADGRDF